MPKQDLALELFYDGGWHDITAAAEVFTSVPIRITRGQGAEGAAPRPARIVAQLDNATDKYRTSNPESLLYGKAGRATPTRATVGDSVRGAVEASSWACDADRDFQRTPRRGRAWTDVEGGGLLQRIAQWSERMKSPFCQYNTDLTTLAGYWPMEDPRGTTLPYTPVPGAETLRFFGVSFDSQQRPPGSAPLADVVLQDQSQFRFVGGAADSTSGWQYSIVSYMTTIGSFITPIEVECLDGSSVGFSIRPSTNETVLQASDPTSTTRFTSTNSIPAEFGSFEGRWVMIVLKATYSGGTTTVDAYYRAIDDDIWWNPTGSYSGVTSSVYRSLASGLPDGSTFGHVTATVGTSESLTDEARFTAFRGYADETAADRFARLCTLKGVAYSIIGTAAESFPMGPQQRDTFPNQLKEIVTTEDGILFDAIDDIELVLLLRNHRYNQTPALNLTPTDLPVLPREVTDDLDPHNIVTASQREGRDYTVRDDTGPLGTQAPPDGAGEFEQTVNVNVADEARDLPEIAYWWLAKGTVELPRYPQVTVNLAALDATKITEIEGVEVGSVITLTGFREYTIRLYVLGWIETIGTHSRKIAFTCASDVPYGEIAIYDTTRADSRTTTLKTALDLSQTAATFRTTNILDIWDTTQTPYEVVIAGQRCRVTSMGAASLVAGAYDQAATLVRGIDGIRKPLAAGEPIHLAADVGGRYALGRA